MEAKPRCKATTEVTPRELARANRIVRWQVFKAGGPHIDALQYAAKTSPAFGPETHPTIVELQVPRILNLYPKFV